MPVPAPPYVLSLMEQAATLRAAGNTWETIALRLHRTARTIQRWQASYAADWGRFYRAAANRQLEEAGLEAYLHLRNLMRTDDTRAIERIAKFLYDRWHKVANEQEKVAAAAKESGLDRYDK